MSAISDALAGRSGQGLSSILAQLNTLLTPTEQLPGTQSRYSVLLAQPGMVSRAAPMANATGASNGAPGASQGSSSLQGLLKEAAPLKTALSSLFGTPISAADAATWASGAPADNAVTPALGSVAQQTAPESSSIQVANDAALASQASGDLGSLASFASGAPADGAVASQLGSVGAQTAPEAAAIQASNDAALNSTDGGTAGAAAARVSPLRAIAGDAGNALGIYNGIKQGGAVGDTSAAINAADLATRAGYLGGSTGLLGTAAGYGAPLLGIYSGIKQGGPLGYGEAALSTYGLASQLGLAPSISSLLAPAASAAAPVAATAPAATSAATGAGLGVGGATALGAAALPLALAAFVPYNSGFSGPEVQGMLNDISAATKANGGLLNAGSGISNGSVSNPQLANAYQDLTTLIGDNPEEFSKSGGTSPIVQQLTAMGYGGLLGNGGLLNGASPITTALSGSKTGWLGGGYRPGVVRA